MSAPRSSLPPYPDDYNFVHPPGVPCGDELADLSYILPLDAEQEVRAAALYRESLVILAHSHSVEPWDFEEMRESGIHAVVLKVDVDGMNTVNGKRRPGPFENEDWFRRGNRAMSRIHEIAERPGSAIRIVRGIEDLDRARRDGHVGIILSFEGARPLCGKLENVRHYYDLGMRELQLWWAVPNETKTPDQQALSEFGLELVRELNRVGVLIDLSHMTGRALEQVLATTKRPVTISHCAVNELYEKSMPGETRFSGTDLLNDAAIRAVAANGGLICLHFVTPDYIKARHGAVATVEDLVDHLVYVRDLVGIEHVALGPDYFSEGGWRWVRGAGRMKLFRNVAREMVRRGLTDEAIRAVLGGNLTRIFKNTWKS